jgi:hypothetical protein
MLGMGDSIGEGVQSADASWATQPFSYLNLLAWWFGFPFDLPLIKSGFFGVVGDTSQRSRLMPGLAAANLAVSGADVDSLVNDRADATSAADIDSETDLVLFPRRGSQIEIAESVRAPFIFCWIGNSDVLAAATSFDQLDASQMTPVEEFAAAFKAIVQRLGALGSVVTFANIPDVTRIGFLVDRQDLLKFLGSDFGLAEGEHTSIVVMLLIRLGLDDGSLLQDPNFVLDADEVARIQERIATFNRLIAEAAATINMPVADIHARFAAVAAVPPVFFGIPLTPRFLGGLFSLDGVHPSNIGHALIANTFIEAINAHFRTNIPSISETVLNFIFLTDPFVDKDGDGRVPGRFGAGLLETLGPVLGISGDFNDFTPAVAGIEARPGKRFVEPFLMPQTADLEGAAQWDRRAVMEAFRDIFGLRIFDR